MLTPDQAKEVCQRIEARAKELSMMHGEDGNVLNANYVIHNFDGTKEVMLARACFAPIKHALSDGSIECIDYYFTIRETSVREVRAQLRMDYVELVREYLDDLLSTDLMEDAELVSENRKYPVRKRETYDGWVNLEEHMFVRVHCHGRPVSKTAQQLGAIRAVDERSQAILMYKAVKDVTGDVNLALISAMGFFINAGGSISTWAGGGHAALRFLAKEFVLSMYHTGLKGAEYDSKGAFSCIYSSGPRSITTMETHSFRDIVMSILCGSVEHMELEYTGVVLTDRARLGCRKVPYNAEGYGLGAQMRRAYYYFKTLHKFKDEVHTSLVIDGNVYNAVIE